jgi:membrane protease YdiL (CAAX protease family)
VGGSYAVAHSGPTASRSRISGRRLLLAMAIWLVLAGAGVGLAAALLRLVQPAPAPRADLFAAALLEAYLSLLAALLVTFGGPSGLRRELGFRFTSASHLALAFVTWLACLAGGALVDLAFVPILGRPPSNTASLLRVSFDPLFVVLVVLTICLVAPACEELFFRGALYGWMRGRMPPLVAIPLSALIFAGAHVIPPLIPMLFVFGLGAAWIRERTGSTLNSFAMHATQNTFAVVVTYALLFR